MVTLYHWDLPDALSQLGGWLNPESATWFNEYANFTFNEYGSKVSSISYHGIPENIGAFPDIGTSLHL